jgi:hypothetical protein
VGGCARLVQRTRDDCDVLLAEPAIDDVLPGGPPPIASITVCVVKPRP